MKLVLKLQENKIKISLLNGKKLLDFKELDHNRDLDQKLISGLDFLLKKNNVDITDLRSYTLYSEVGLDSTSYKITKAFVEGLKTAD